MSKTNLNFSDIDIKQSAFYNSKYPINIEKVYIKKILISNKVLYRKKMVLNTLLAIKMTIKLKHCV